MSVIDRGAILQKSIRSVLLQVFTAVLVIGFSGTALATADRSEIEGKFYEFDKDSHYEFSESDSYTKTGNENTYGTFSISGNISNIGIEGGLPSYEVSEGNLALFYNYGDRMLNEDEDSWHLIEDRSKQVDTLTLDESIMNGAIILQTSKDLKTWINVEVITNAFGDTPIRTSAIYNTTDIQLINGCYYRVIVVYELSIRIEESNFLFINTDKYDYKKCVEVYEFYAFVDSEDGETFNSNQTYSLGTKVKVNNFDGYFGEEIIDKDDPHYGWELGNFFVSGYTDEITDSNGNMIFLKNVGDKVVLWFKLNENIDSLNGQKSLSITADTEGYDQYFETSKMNFGRGALIIRYTNHNNVKAEPTIYTNYLEANATAGADTKVQLFEEGDYEVALDYEITNDQLIDTIGHYRIFFKFSVRNGNCMVYLFDVETGSELTNSSLTENGFRLDLAKSRYLKVNIKREVLKDGADGLVEDTRFNGPAKDGAEYTDEGVYTITVDNEYTDQSTVKKIYVGTNSVLKAHIATGLSIPEINDLVKQGATISDDGSIQLPEPTLSIEETGKTEKASSISSNFIDEDVAQRSVAKSNTGSYVVLVISVAAIAMLIWRLKNHQKETKKEGGDVQ